MWTILIKQKPPEGGLDWWALRGSNSRPSRCKRDALPAELSARSFNKETYTLIKNINQVFFLFIFYFFYKYPINQKDKINIFSYLHYQKYYYKNILI